MTDKPGLPVAARHIDEWHEDMGDVLWWTNPVTEAPWVGNPLVIGAGYELSIGEFSTVVHLGGWPGYHEWWTPLPPIPALPCVCVTSGGGPEGCGVCNETGVRK